MSIVVTSVLALSLCQAVQSRDSAQAAEKPIVIRNVRIQVSPTKVIESGTIVVVGQKIKSIGTDVAIPLNSEVIDGKGLTAYAGFIHPQMSTPVDGVSPASGGAGGPGGGGGRGQGANQTQAERQAAQTKRDTDPFGLEGNLLSGKSIQEAKEFSASALQSMPESGYAIANVFPSGGLIGAQGGLYFAGETKQEGKSAFGVSPLQSIRVGARGFGGYPNSTMGAIYVIRQALADAVDFRTTADKPNPTLENLKKTTSGINLALFEDLNQVSFFQANRIRDEFQVKPVYSFRQDSGWLISHLKSPGSEVILRGVIPPKPSVSDPSTASLLSIRSYFNEVQAGKELEKQSIRFSYAPASTVAPLDGIRTYVQGGLSKSAALAALTTEPAKLLRIDREAGTLEIGKLANITLVNGDLFDSSSQIMATIVNGRRAKFDMPKPKSASELKASGAISVMAPNYQLFPRPSETEKAYRLYRNATIWTQGPKGVLQNADILIHGGSIISVGRGLDAPRGCEIIDATGKHISPGIWDCHSHTGISGSVNEGSNMITAECRIRDVIDHTSNNIYLQLSGGTVGANQLHGSANAIGGQNSTVKWRWGRMADEFPVSGAPEGVKFALGQNPIREDEGGFGNQQPVGATLLTFRPRTRMGVEEAIRRALQLGKEYNQSWNDFRTGKTTVQPRRDLQLEALGEIVSGKRWIHSHGYRADEMLMLIRVAKEYGAKVATLQHVLEGYKIADEMAAAGVAGSTFSDWWGYKLEAYDAIPQNAALMAARGVSVSVNSDSDNHARRLNQEAAKSMRYGGATAEQALGFVTIEPAKQLGIDKLTGSLEPGKDADIAIWSAEPLSIFAVCLETYVDGVKRFDRADDLKQRDERLKEIAEAKKVLESGVSEGNPFDTGSGPSTGTNSASSGPLSKGKHGIGPLTGQPATSRYERKAIHITGAMIHPMVGDPFVGDVSVDANGKIVEVGKSVSTPKGGVRIDGRGKHVYPGLIDPATGIGLNEIGQVPTSDDSSERGDFHPDYRVERTINPEWDTLAVARNQGVLTVLVKPSGGGIPGQAALIHTEGYTWEDLTIQGGVALTYSMGGGGGRFGDSRFDDGHVHTDDCCSGTQNHDVDDLTSGQGPGQGQGAPTASSLESLTERLVAARKYADDHAKGVVPRDQRQEAMLQVAQGKLPVIISANSAADIKAAVAWSEKENVKILLYGCSGAGEIADWLAQTGTPICLAAVYSMPRADQPVDFYYNLPARLAKAGVKFCLTTNNDKDVRQIRDQAGWAAAYGLDREEAARLITLRAAEVMGIEDRLGAIKAGLDGTLIMTDGEIIETKTQTLRAWIQGREVDLFSRQTKLYDKYRTRPVPRP